MAGVIEGDKWRIYVDGVLQSHWNGTNTSPVYQPTGNTYIGYGDPSLGNTGFEGAVKEVRWWKEARTATEFSDGMHQTLTSSEAKLIGYWRLNEAE